MPDMLVRLYDLPPLEPSLARMKDENIIIRRGLAPEKHLVLDWVEAHFSAYWRSEVDVAYNRNPVTCFIAIENGELVGFGCHETTRKGFFGPTGVAESMRGRGVGKALLLMCLHDMYQQGYAYGVIGGVGPVEFYEKAVGAFLIPESNKGVYDTLLRKKK